MTVAIKKTQNGIRGKMDTAIDLSDASKALDLANIRFQLMYDSSQEALILEIHVARSISKEKLKIEPVLTSDIS